MPNNSMEYEWKISEFQLPRRALPNETIQELASTWPQKCPAIHWDGPGLYSCYPILFIGNNCENLAHQLVVLTSPKLCIHKRTTNKQCFQRWRPLGDAQRKPREMDVKYTFSNSYLSRHSLNLWGVIRRVSKRPLMDTESPGESLHHIY